MRYTTDHITYLAAPFTSPDPEVAASRERAVKLAASKLIRDGNIVFSPVNYGHGVEGLVEDLSQDEWYRFDLVFLRRCDSVTVLTLPGWEQSIGVNIEIDQAKRLGIPVYYLDPERIRAIDGLP